jgi:hypothetical protein
MRSTLQIQLPVFYSSLSYNILRILQTARPSNLVTYQPKVLKISQHLAGLQVSLLKEQLAGRHVTVSELSAIAAGGCVSITFSADS